MCGGHIAPAPVAFYLVCFVTLAFLIPLSQCEDSGLFVRTKKPLNEGSVSAGILPGVDEGPE